MEEFVLSAFSKDVFIILEQKLEIPKQEDIALVLTA